MEKFNAFAIDDKEFARCKTSWKKRSRCLEPPEELDGEEIWCSSRELKLAEKYSNLDVNDKSECLRAINESKAHLRAKNYFNEESMKDTRENTGGWGARGVRSLEESNRSDGHAHNMNDEL
ncbi:hypothetical protein MO867_10485 [Microbulbifer sp. OS29]|uniref:Uncharacterized protein n=1 Tax=Microbulbifer okhotskensis TaxID=2926617 RepID=A0A9X2EN30_9GAMM|nr:hypothetical protein [Microbulbifer okhotskensis]MCO1334766.1 hypothetical protein [Microbulbifer okhotskensis]